jgi:hypothetical protein
MIYTFACTFIYKVLFVFNQAKNQAKIKTNDYRKEIKALLKSFP